MSVALLLSDPESAARVLPWAARLASARSAALLVLETAEGAGVAALELDRDVDLVKVEGRGDPNALLKLLVEREVELLIIPRTARPRGDDPATVFERRLFLRAPCDTMMLRVREDREGLGRILVPTAGGAHSRLALRMAAQLAEADDERVTALFVEPKIGSEAEAIGKRILSRIVKGAASGQADRIDEKVVVNDDVVGGIASAVDEEVGLVLAGASYLGTVKRLLFGALSDKLLAREGPAVAVVRRSIPFASRVRQAVDRWLHAAIPQLDREGRLTLVERVQSNSSFDFDFVALLCLSTLIAALGLVQNAAAVIIGAMLVAPLMTPLVGTGLALVQGNLRLIRNALRSVLLGFLCAFALGSFIGWTVPPDDLTREMLSRGSPSALDLVIAVLSGVAAAYASSRPHLSAALPGVAIAAALVPPIATSGLALSLGRYDIATGAALLFATNMVAIVLGSAGCLWAVGFRASHQHGRLSRWVPFGVALAVVLFGLTAWILEAGEIPDELDRKLRETVGEARAKVVALDVRGSTDAPTLHVVVEARRRVDEGLADRLRALAADVFGNDVSVRLETHLVTETTR